MMRMETKIDFFCKRQNWGRGIELAALTKDANGGVSICRISLEKLAEGDTYSEPTITMNMNEAQVLIDELWGCGLRPSEGSGSAGSLAATERHLKDMQTIAMGLLRKDGAVT